MGGNYGLFGYFEDVLVLDTFYPAVAVYDDRGWAVEIPSHNGDLTYYDASLYLVRVTAPKAVTVIASGIEIGREQKGKTQTLTFAAGPGRDFYIAASDRYVRVSETMGETTVHSYAFSGRREEARSALAHAVTALSILGARFGTYPYSELDVLSTPMTALGIEYPGVVGISLKLYDPDAVVSGLSSAALLETVVVHEVAHQWFYNAVGNDQVREPWLDEAIVQYVVELYYADAYGPQAAQSYREAMESRWQRVDRAEIPIGLPTCDYDGEEYGAIVYGRGPLFIAALADRMGQATFDAFLRDYYQSYEWRIGTAKAFRQLAEQHCQCDLTAMFDAWVYAN
jgi:aminopeptidase N